MVRFEIIEGFENYEINKSGKIRNIKTQIIINQTRVKNSNYVYMYRGKKQYGRLVARLVAIAFIPNPNNYKFIKPKDGDFLNVDSSNLEWVKDSRKAKAKRPYKEYKNRLLPDYEFIEDIRRQVKEYDDKLNYFK